MFDYELMHRVSSHERSATDHYRQRRRRRSTGEEPGTVGSVAHREHLYQSAVAIAREGGPAAGPDGVFPRELTKTEISAGVFAAAECLRDGNYVPGEKRVVRIPKPAGGTRTIRVANFLDRVVSHAVTDRLAEYVVPEFSMANYGHLGVATLLADIKLAAENSGQWVIAAADIRKAFDTVPTHLAFRELLELARAHGLRVTGGAADDFWSLVRVILTAGMGHRIGIDQGCSLSPLALDALLTAYDDWIAETVQQNYPRGSLPIRTFRYVDNIYYLCSSKSQGREVLREASKQLKDAGLTLGTASVHTVSRRRCLRVLGMWPVRSGDQLRYRIHEEVWTKLEAELHEVYLSTQPHKLAWQIVQGRVAQLGPVIESEPDLLDRIQSILRRVGLREGFSRKRLEESAESALTRWRALLDDRRARREN